MIDVDVLRKLINCSKIEALKKLSREIEKEIRRLEAGAGEVADDEASRECKPKKRAKKAPAEVIEIDLNEIKEPILCAPNDPDDARTLSEVAGTKIDEVFLGSCMTNIGHFRAAGKLLDADGGVTPTRLWISPPTRMDAAQLTEEGYYSIFGKAGARMEMPGCSLCMGNQARVADAATVVSTCGHTKPSRAAPTARARRHRRACAEMPR